jgi:hypothetical protein
MQNEANLVPPENKAAQDLTCDSPTPVVFEHGDVADVCVAYAVGDRAREANQAIAVPGGDDERRTTDELGEPPRIARAAMPSRLLEEPCELEDVDVLCVVIGDFVGPLHATSLHRLLGCNEVHVGKGVSMWCTTAVELDGPVGVARSGPAVLAELEVGYGAADGDDGSTRNRILNT